MHRYLIFDIDIELDRQMHHLNNWKKEKKIKLVEL